MCTFKKRMMETLFLSCFEKLELLFKCEPLGGRKPSQPLAIYLSFPALVRRKGFFPQYVSPEASCVSWSYIEGRYRWWGWGDVEAGKILEIFVSLS
jgi:hypothetical protein